MNGEYQNSLEFFDEIKKEWCVSEEQWKPFWNDVLTFARKYHKERVEYSKKTETNSELNKPETGSFVAEKAREYAKFIYDESYSDPAYQPEVTQSIADFEAGFNSCIPLLRKAYDIIPDGTSHDDLPEIKMVLFNKK